MKCKVLCIGLILLVVVIGAAIFLDPTAVLWGYLKREPFFNGRPATYWHRALKSQDPTVQKETDEKLKAGGPAAVPVLIVLLTEKRDAGDVRWKAAEILGNMGADGADAVPALATALRDDDPHVRAVAATAL